MEKIKKLILMMFMLVILPILASAQSDLGTFQQDKCITLHQICSNCTYVNLTSVKNPNGTLVNINADMTKQSFDYNFSYCNTSAIGDYIYNTCGNQDGLDSCENINFRVTPSGKEATTSESILYFLFTIILFGLLLTMFYFIVVLPSDNFENEGGQTVQVAKLKYLRIFLIAMTYPIIMIILNLMNGLAVNFSTLTIFSGTLGILFEIMLRGAWAFTISIVLWIFYNLVKDSNVTKNIKKLGRFNL